MTLPDDPMPALLPQEPSYLPPAWLDDEPPELGDGAYADPDEFEGGDDDALS
jgi:hypothetical protein